MSVSIRLSIYWPESQQDEKPEETDTIVITTPSGKYIDIRSYKTEVFSNKNSLRQFPFQWAFAGNELPVKDHPSQAQFSHDFFDSSYILEYCKAKKAAQRVLPSKSDIQIDCGTFKTLEDGVREETGRMRNEETGRIEPYIEHWLTLDPIRSTPNRIVPLKPGRSEYAFDYALFDIIENTQNFEGRFIRLGVWAEGLLWDKSNLDSPISVVRFHFENEEWRAIISFGDGVHYFHSLTLEKVESGDTIKNSEVIWVCLEKGAVKP